MTNFIQSDQRAAPNRSEQVDRTGSNTIGQEVARITCERISVITKSCMCSRVMWVWGRLIYWTFTGAQAISLGGCDVNHLLTDSFSKNKERRIFFLL